MTIKMLRLESLQQTKVKDCEWFCQIHFLHSSNISQSSLSLVLLRCLHLRLTLPALSSFVQLVPESSQSKLFSFLLYSMGWHFLQL